MVISHRPRMPHDFCHISIAFAAAFAAKLTMLAVWHNI
ncbi:hypothetical protein BN938_2108 [Mucinivorans hirudinis]|uniref:Uncharacterized protein n=1 Tax=Mucinivorans hirudinis TaxID=1433126 RepID=A0A060R9A2_9BACT|nr:hypothetical protein BN938_2108 [Mucinivorans hirudinis]